MVDKELDSHLKLEIIEDYVSYLTDYDLKKNDNYGWEWIGKKTAKRYIKGIVTPDRVKIAVRLAVENWFNDKLKISLEMIKWKQMKYWLFLQSRYMHSAL